MRTVAEDDLTPIRLLNGYSINLGCISIALSLAGSTYVVLTLFSLVIAPLLVLHCRYFVRPDNTQVRFRHQIQLSAATAFAAAGFGSSLGLRPNTFDPLSGFIFGGIGFVCVYATSIVVGAAADVVFNRVRRFPEFGECQSCGYDLMGNISGVCPECGRDVPLYLRKGPPQQVFEENP